MAQAIDMVYNDFLKIEHRPQLLLKESFIMNIFKPLYQKLPELKDYLTYFFEEKEIFVYTNMDNDSHKRGIKLVSEEVFLPIEANNRTFYDCCVWLISDFAAIIILEMCDPKRSHEIISQQLMGNIV